MMIRLQTDVEDRDHVCLWGTGQICFLMEIIKKMSPSGGKLGGFVSNPLKGLGFPNLRVPRLWLKHVVYAASTWACLCIAPIGLSV